MVYPRPRGGTGIGFWTPPDDRGLSPPTRGNPKPRERRTRTRGSIPAHAGEPFAWLRLKRGRRVYPRPRGGTKTGRLDPKSGRGLSPPTRGNRGEGRRAEGARRSIPAHAGEPLTSAKLTRWARVYPRPRGGTSNASYSSTARTGLSPPTRGNREPNREAAAQQGSIPAHAGEPAWAVRIPRRRWVYPRPRGGTHSRSYRRADTGGLSPPTRGNPPTPDGWRRGLGSIPAHAGEPYPAVRIPQSVWVYPRPRGGTPANSSPKVKRKGLSPPTRGNPARPRGRRP